ncbi:MAG TPA: class I cytochrome c [Hydrogenophaga sp.]|uniref:c-type cytochrome n=1 Tax=Hydrogenophaga sp. TaxID=1904254 RepID=UPI002B7975AB|nr:c-type cytochrome [Hydrogenophaga sp.]HMN92828.1 class I cytochrome c [Hydrogenophaga sp.]HMP10331.1 class I cytochrome c [Hydrogenophaga sp.]
MKQKPTRRCLGLPWLALPLLLGVTGAALAQAPAAPRDPQAFQVQIWATSCMACHGPEGRAEGTGLTIGGRPAQDLLGKLLAYKTGRLPATIMHQHVKGYSDEELAQIAEYFSTLK